MINHDQLFKQLLTTFFLEFLDLFTPELAQQVDPKSVKFLAQEQFLDFTSGEKKIVDILAEVTLSGQDAGILIHVEAQATAAANFSRRMFFYFARLYQKYLRNVYPIVLFSFDQPQREEPSSHIVKINNLKILEFNFESIQLNRLNWRDYLNQDNPIAAALMAKMKIAPSDRPKVKAECLQLLATLKLNPAKNQLILGFVDTYLKLNESEQQEFQNTIDTMDPTEQEGIMQIVTSWMEQGIEQGIEQGQKSEAFSLVMRLITRKFGSISAIDQEKVEALSLSQIENLGEALLDLNSLAELTDWLNTPPSDG